MAAPVTRETWCVVLGTMADDVAARQAHAGRPVVKGYTVYFAPGPKSKAGGWRASATARKGGFIYNFALGAQTRDDAEAEAAGLFVVLTAVS